MFKNYCVLVELKDIISKRFFSKSESWDLIDINIDLSLTQESNFFDWFMYFLFQTLYNNKIRQMSSNNGTVSPRNAVSPVPGLTPGQPQPQVKKTF